MLWHSPSNWGYGPPRLGVAPEVALAISTFVWPLELGIRTPFLGVAPRVAHTTIHAFVWPLKLGIRTPAHRPGPSKWRYGSPCFGLTS